MFFISFEFLVFLPTVITIYFILKVKWRWLWLLISSYFFYGYHNPSYIILLLLSTGIDFIAGKRINATKNKKQKKNWLYISVCSNLGILFFFKYFNFFSEEINQVLQSINIAYSLPQHSLLLPLGISFYTFQTLSYTIDIYRGYLKPEQHFGKFALYVCFFPQLVAGPIERAKKLLTQFHFNYKFEYQRVVEGCQLILWGFFKKLVVADRLGMYVNEVYDINNNHHGLPIIIASILFAFQIFYDFAAYSDIAIGSARILGIKLSKNFDNHTYFTSPTEHWRGWHITLTEWFRDYLFFPLLKINQKKWFWHMSLILTFAITGLWHGASWSFLIWGLLHGIYLMVDYLTSQKRKIFFEKIGISKHPKLFNVISYLLVTPLFWFAVLFFRAKTTQDSFVLLNRLTDWSSIYLDVGLGTLTLGLMFFWLIFIDLINWQLGKNQIHQFLGKKSTVFRWVFYLVLIYSIIFFRVPNTDDFIYFNF